MARDLTRPALAELVPYEPGKPVEEVQRELGLERVVKLASNEGQFGPFPAALERSSVGLSELNRYPDGGACRLVQALAEKHDVEPSNVAVAAGADAIISYLSLATLDPGDEVVFGWPSFASYPLAALKLGAAPVRVPLTDHRYDVERDPRRNHRPHEDRLPLQPEQPDRDDDPAGPGGRATSPRVPDHVLTVLDEAYFEYLDEPDYPDGIEEHVKAGPRRARAAHLLEDLRPRGAARRLRDRPEGGSGLDQEGEERLRHHAVRPGRRRRQPRRLGRARAPARLQRRGRAHLVELCTG